MTAPIDKTELVGKDCLSAYDVDAVVFYGDPTRIYRARRRSNGTPVMLKTLRDESAAREAAALLQHEFEVAQRLEVPSVAKVFALRRFNNLPVVELEDFGGDSLDHIARQRRFSLEELLEIAVQVTQGLAGIHEANIIHKDINPSNIVYNADTGVAKIIDFGISTYLTREQAALTSPQVFEGSLPYISPEQTGRMNRSIDYRSDFYSLGVTLYEMLTGRPLFVVNEPIEWFHCHIAKKPTPPDEINPDILRPISDIIMKLIAKTAEDRYQSAHGILADLKHCLKELKQTGHIAPFPLAANDLSDRFQIPQRLYGRSTEIAQLLANFDQVAQGNCKMILVSGYSGVGKTCLIKEIYKPITERRGHFVGGKFDQLTRNVPYSALASALRDLVRQLLTEPDEQLETWRIKILDAVGPNGGLITSMIRELELIIGPQPQAPEVGPIEAEQRFHRVFQRFIQVFCKPEHPLVMFIDDLQWADTTSLRLLDLLINTESGITHLLLIGAYRANEVPSAHPVGLWLKKVRRGDFPLDEIHLRPLSGDHLSELLADTLGTSTANVAPLTDIVSRKTAGNPFFTEEFLKTLNQMDLISFSRTKGVWTWDIEQIRTQQITDNVVDLMTAKLKQLTPKTRELLELAACIGFRFPLYLLIVVSERPPAAVAKQLDEGIKMGLIAPIGSAYQLLELEQMPDATTITVELAFAHDRIHQAAYSLLDMDRRHQAHLKIGRLLRNQLTPAQQEERLFEITNHLNLGVELIKDPEERDTLCKLNVAAGRRAKSSNAFQPAFDHFQVAMLLLGPNAWEQAYELTLALYTEAAETAYLNGNHDAMETLLSVGFKNAREVLDKIGLYLVKISACILRGRVLEAVEIAKPVMAQLGHVYPAKPNKLHLILKLIQLKWALRGKEIDDLRKLPLMTDPRHLAAETLGQQIGGAAMFAQPLLLPLMVFNSIKTSIKQGLCPVSLGSYNAYGMILAESFGKVDRGIAFGKLGVELLDRFKTSALKCRVLHVYNALVRHWKEPLRNSLPPLHEAFCMCLETGDFEYAAHAVVVRQGYSFETGMELNSLLEEMKEYYKTVKPLKQGTRIDYLLLFMQTAANLMGQNSNPARLTGEFYDIDEKIKQHETLRDKSLLTANRMQQCYISYLFGHFQEALTLTDAINSDSGTGMQGFYYTIVRHFMDSLVRLGNVPHCEGNHRRRLLRQVKRNLARLKRWAEANPANCLNKQRLVEAEQLRVLGKHFEAHHLYDEAIRLARQQGFIHEEALSNELCGTMHANADRLTIATPYLTKARDLYNHWGALAKVQDLEQRFPQLAEKIHHRGGTTSWGTNRASVDINSLIKALKAIAEETVHSRMVEIIIATAIEFAGAQMGILMLRNPEGVLCIEAEASVDGGDPRILQSIPVIDGHLPQSVINYVSRTGSSIVIHDAQQPNDQIPGLNLDPYIQEHSVLSLLCLPILTGNSKEGDVIGMLYLENNRASGTFTQNRFETLEIICLSAAGRLELSRKAVVDGLTELYNHDYFQSLLSQELSSARQHSHHLAVILIDIDHFKRFNDTWGHQVGDQVLREVAQVIKNSCRSGDTVARYGGEEMAVILPMAPKDKAQLVAERIRKAVESHRVMHEGEALQVTISLGVAILDTTTTDKNSLVRQADEALYESKRNGRNQLTVA